MALSDGIEFFAQQLRTHSAHHTAEAAALFAQSFARFFGYATLAGSPLAPDSNLTSEGLSALTEGLQIAYSENTAQQSALRTEEAIQAYLEESPVSAMWPGALEVRRLGPSLRDVLKRSVQGYERDRDTSLWRVAEGFEFWLTEAVQVKIGTSPDVWEGLV